MCYHNQFLRGLASGSIGLLGDICACNGKAVAGTCKPVSKCLMWQSASYQRPYV